MFLFTYNLIHSKTSPKYCLHILFPFLHLQIAIQFAAIWLMVLLKLLFSLYHPKYSGLFSGLILVFLSCLAHLTPLSFIKHSSFLILWHHTLLDFFFFIYHQPLLLMQFCWLILLVRTSKCWCALELGYGVTLVLFSSLSFHSFPFPSLLSLLCIPMA